MPFGKFTRKQVMINPRERKQVRKIAQRVVNRNISKRRIFFAEQNTAVSNTGTTRIIQIADGSLIDQRDGNECRLTLFILKIHIKPNSLSLIAPAIYYQPVRVVIYIPFDSDENLTLADPSAEVNPDRFTVLYDRLVPVGFEYVPPTLFYKKRWNKGSTAGLKQRYKGPLATDLTKNAVKILYQGIETTAVEKPQIYGSFTCHYTTG